MNRTGPPRRPAACRASRSGAILRECDPAARARREVEASSVAVLLPLIGYLLLFALFVRRTGSRRASVLHAALVYGVLTVGITEGLSLAGWLTRAGLATSWGLVDSVAVLVLLAAGRTRPAEPRPAATTIPSPSGARLGVVDRALVLAVAAIVALVGVVAVISPPNTWDAMEYHLPRVWHWLHQRGLAFYATHETKQLHMTPGAEFLVLQLHGLAGGDRFDNLVQWFAFAGSVVGITLIARALGASARGQLLAAVTAATIPEGILQASGAKNDYVLTLWLVAMTVYFLALRTAPTWGNTLGAGTALTLACFTKATAYVL